MVNEKYFARFMGRDGQIRRLSIGQEGFTGIAKKMTLTNSGITISEDNSEGITPTIRSWSGYATVIDDGFIGDLVAKNAHDLTATLSIENGETEWTGYVSPEIRTQYYPSVNTELEIPLCGKLYTAGGYNIDEKPGMATLGELLHEALTLSGYTNADTLLWPNTYGIKSAANGLSLLAITISRTIFLTGSRERTTVQKGDADDTPITATAGDVLSEIAKVFGFTWYERGGKVTAVSPRETNYLSISIGDLKTIAPSSDFITLAASPITAGTFNIAELEGSDSNFSKINGCHSVTVSLDLQKVNGNLFDLNLEDFAFVNSYKRPLDYSNPPQGYKFLFTQVFEKKNFKDIETFVYYRQSAGSEENFQTGWFPYNSVKEAQWSYSYRQGAHNSKPGCFPARISTSDENPYYDPQHKPGSQPNQWLIGHDFTDGFIFNPAYYEDGEYGFIGNKYPILKFHKKETGVYSKGTFALNFNVGAFPVCKDGQNSPDPATPFCRFSISLRVGEYKYRVVNHHAPDGTWSEWGWEKTEEPPTQIAVHTLVSSENAFPSSLIVKDNRGSGRYPNRAMPNVKGMTFPIWDKDGNEIVLTGDVEFTLYADPNDKMTGDNKKTKPRLVFLSDVKFEFISEDQYPEGYVPSKKETERKLHRLTHMGFEDGEDKVDLLMGSFAADNSTSLSAMVYNGVGLEKVVRVSDNIEKAPEEFLLDNLYDYNNRIVERRELTIEQGAQLPPSNTIEVEGKQWRQVAISENYGEGTRTIIMEDA